MKSPPFSPVQLAGLLIGISFLALGLVAPFSLLPASSQRALGIALCALILWSTEPVPIEFSSLVLLLLIPAIGLLSFEESFAPFATKTIWLIFAGMSLSLGLSTTGLGDALASWILGRLSQRVPILLLQLHLVGLLAAFLIPSGVIRVLLLMPIGISLVTRMGKDPSPNLKAAILLSLLCSTYFGGCGILTGSVPNLVLAGQYEKAQHTPIFWATWLYWMFPVIGLVRTLLSFGIIWLLYGRQLRPDDIRIEPPSIQTTLTRPQRLSLYILCTGVGLWASDLVHQIQPAYIGLVLVLLFILPRFGPLRAEDLSKVRFTFLFYIAALFTLGKTLEATGFDHLFIEALSQEVKLTEYGWLAKHLGLTLIALPLDFLMDIGAVAGVVTIPLIDLGAIHGIAPLPAAFSVAMATTLAFLPYQSAPFMVAYSFRHLSMRQLVITQSIISGISLLLLCPLNLVYWRWLGLI